MQKKVFELQKEFQGQPIYQLRLLGVPAWASFALAVHNIVFGGQERQVNCATLHHCSRSWFGSSFDSFKKSLEWGGLCYLTQFEHSLAFRIS